MSEPFSWNKAVDFSPLTIFKAIKVGLILCGLAFIGFTIYRAYCMPTNTQKQTTQIKVESGGTLNLTQSQKQEGKKRPWWMPTLFIEGYGFIETWGTESRTGVGTRGGGRWEF